MSETLSMTDALSKLRAAELDGWSSFSDAGPDGPSDVFDWMYCEGLLDYSTCEANHG